MRDLRNLITLGQIAATSYTSPVGTAQVQFSDIEVSERVPTLAQHGLSSRPMPGAECVVLHLNGHRSSPLILATSDGRYRPTTLGPGETAIYNANGMIITLSATGITVNGGGQPVTISNASSVTINGCDLIVNGGDVIADGISLKQHKHKDSQPGSGQTGTPV